MRKLLVGPFNRVEGDLEVRLEIDGDRVRNAWVNSSLYRGFEQILHGRDPRDAPVVTARICGICSVSQSMAAAAALADLQRLEAPRNGALARNLILACENLADHLTHFYLFFMPDFAREGYRNAGWYPHAEQRFRALTGAAPRAAVAARNRFMHLLGILAGKWPHTLAIQPGGSTRPIERAERVRLRVIIDEFRRFAETTLFGDRLDAVLALSNEDELWQWWEHEAPQRSDLRFFLHLARELGLERLGRANDRFMSYGAYPLDGGHLFARGLWQAGARPLDLAAIREDLSHSWMAGDEPLPPAAGVTLPDPDKADGYSWCKAPRLAGETAEVGALARQLVDGQPLIHDLVARSGGNVRNRVVARLLEIARLLPRMAAWVDALRPGEPFCAGAPLAHEGRGVGLVEAARGSLGHWLEVRNGNILNYQIIAPTTWNFSPRDADGLPGPLEQALIGAPVHAGEQTPVAVQHVVRSFDPCMVCTVH